MSNEGCVVIALATFFFALCLFAVGVGVHEDSKRSRAFKEEVALAQEMREFIVLRTEGPLGDRLDHAWQSLTLAKVARAKSSVEIRDTWQESLSELSDLAEEHWSALAVHETEAWDEAFGARAPMTTPTESD